MAVMGTKTIPCLVCNSDICKTNYTHYYSSKAEDNETQHSSDPINRIMATDLHVVFVLRQLFEVPGERLQSYLTQYGSPSEWPFIAYCDGCSKVVKNAQRIYQEVIEASRKFKRVKQEIVEKVKNTCKRQIKKLPKSVSKKPRKHWSVSSVKGKDEKLLKLIENTREFIFKHDYGPLSDPFLNEDMMTTNSANGLGCSTSSAQLESDTIPDFTIVKNEVIKMEVEDDSSNFEEPNQLSTDNESAIITSYDSNLLMEPNDLELKVPSVPILNFEEEQEMTTSDKRLSLKSKKSMRKRNGNAHKKEQFKSIFLTLKSSKKKGKSESAPKVFKCEYKDCERVYAYKTHLRDHLMMHRGEKPFACSWPHCSWRFTRNDILRRHYQMHLPVKPFKCQFCFMDFSRKDVLGDHMKARHHQQEASVKVTDSAME